MTKLAILRHAPTPWNKEGKLQGRTDVPLSAEGIALAETWRLPKDVARWASVSSPLRRAKHTAELLLETPVSVDHRLIELSFGEWEGERLKDLRQRLGERMRANEERGLDFQPPGGESPRAVMARLRPFLAEVALRNQPTVAVAHKAVIRALYAEATGWDMTSDPPQKLRDACYHVFDARPRGTIDVVQLNNPLLKTEAPNG